MNHVSRVILNKAAKCDKFHFRKKMRRTITSRGYIEFFCRANDENRDKGMRTCNFKEEKRNGC